MTIKRGSRTTKRFVIQPAERVFSEVKTKDITAKEVGSFYCQALAERKRCPLQKGNSCWACLPALKRIIEQDYGDIDNLNHYLKWLLREYAEGNISVRKRSKPSTPKKHSTYRQHSASALVEKFLSNNKRHP